MKDVSSELKCLVVSLPVVYLGIPLGANPMLEGTCEPNYYQD